MQIVNGKFRLSGVDVVLIDIVIPLIFAAVIAITWMDPINIGSMGAAIIALGFINPKDMKLFFYSGGVIVLLIAAKLAGFF